MQSTTIIIRHYKKQPYHCTLLSMQDFTRQRNSLTHDEVWFIEHDPVFTQGQAGKAEHIISPTAIPVIQSDRGGQVTYHAPGQQIMYLLIDLRRQQLSVRQFVMIMENTVINTLANYDIDAYANSDAPGVYVAGKKICSLGLRLKKGFTSHGLALNIQMNLTPFSAINPCGHKGMMMTQISDLVTTKPLDFSLIRQQLTQYFVQQLGYTNLVYQ